VEILEDSKRNCFQDETLHNFLTEACEKFLQAGVSSPRLDAEILIAEGLNISRTALLTHPERILSKAEIEMLAHRIQRRVLREPVSHILGVQEFWSIEFEVSEKVLTPRPETEILIEQCLKVLGKTPVPMRILDLGTGSGILSIILAKEIPQSQVTAIEQSVEALQVARKNILRHAVTHQVSFVSGDLMTVDWQGPYHLIVSNPPYIESADLPQCMPEVYQYEPAQALDGGRDGLDYYRFIVPKAWENLTDNGLLVLEIGHTQAESVVDFMKRDSAYQDIQVVQDYSGYDRVVLARKRTSNG